MTLEILVSLATDRRCYQPGEVVTLEDKAEAARWVKAGYAKELKGRKAAE